MRLVLSQDKPEDRVFSTVQAWRKALRETRARGYALRLTDVDPFTQSIAVPIFAGPGRVIATLGMTFFRRVVKDSQYADYASVLKLTAAAAGLRIREEISNGEGVTSQPAGQPASQPASGHDERGAHDPDAGRPHGRVRPPAQPTRRPQRPHTGDEKVMSTADHKDSIREAMARYCHALDACRFEDVAALFAEDGEWQTDYGSAKGRIAIAAFLATVVPRKGEGPQRKHYITNILITLDAAQQTATARSDYLIIRESETGLIPVMGGTYMDTFVKVGAEWLFKRKELVHDIAGDMALKNNR